MDYLIPAGDGYDIQGLLYVGVDEMPRIAWGYIFFILLGAAIISLRSLADSEIATYSTLVFSALAVVTTFLRIFRVLAPGHRTYEGSTIGFFAGVLLLPFWQFIVLIILAHSVEWVKERISNSQLLRSWYIQPFNMAKCIISGAVIQLLLSWWPVSFNEPVSFKGFLVTLLALVLYVVINQILLGIALYLARGITFRQAGIWRDILLIEFPLASFGLISVVLMNYSPIVFPFVFAPMALIYQAFLFPKLQDETVESLEKLNTELRTANQAIRQVNDELFFTLAKVFDARDPFVGGHAAQVATYAVAVAHEMGLTDKQVEVIRQSAYLHDIGKIAIPESILHKPDKLNDVEFDMIKRHCEIGADFLVNSQSLRHLAPIILSHHERWDGKGYPNQFQGEQIPLEARILNVCDSVEAMASDRPYHRALSVSEICKEVAHCAGTQFDPKVAEAFIKIAEREGTRFVTNSARTVAALYADNNHKEERIFIERLSEIYGMTSA